MSEWTDDYSGREAGANVDPSAVDAADLAAPSGAGRVFRGGSCWDGAGSVRSAYRVSRDPGGEHELLGFRVLAVPPRA